MADVVPVAVEQLIRAFAHLHDDRAVLASELGHEVEGDADPVGDRLVLVMDQIRNEIRRDRRRRSAPRDDRSESVARSPARSQARCTGRGP